MAFLPSFGVADIAQAGELKSPYERATAAKFYDWKFAQKVWVEMNTWDKEEAEWAKYEADFNAWLPDYKKNPQAARDALKKMSPEKRLNIQRGYDMQLAYDEWFDNIYSWWYNSYPNEAVTAKMAHKAAHTFDDEIAGSSKRAAANPTLIEECGPIPDWRSDTWKAKEQAMMQKAEARATSEYAAWVTRHPNAK